VNTDTNAATGLAGEILTAFGQMLWSRNVREGTTTFLTDHFSRVFEVPMETIRLNPELIRAAIHPDDVAYADVYSKALLSNNFDDIDYRIVTPSSSVKWIHEQKQLIKNQEGEIVRIDFLAREITGTKLEEIMLTESEATFRSLFQHNPNPMWVYDLENLQFLAVNEAAVRFYGYTQAEFEKMTIRQIRPAEDVEDLLDAIRNNRLDHRNNKNWRHILKDGQVRHVKLSGGNIQFRDRKARVVLANDITSQVKAESYSQAASQYLTHFRDAVSRYSLMALLDTEGKLLFVNENLRKMRGDTQTDCRGHLWTCLQSDHYRDEQNAAIKDCIFKGKAWKGERKFKGDGDNVFWVNLHLIPIESGPENSEESARFIMMADDITVLKETENRNRQYALKLHSILEGVTDPLFVLDSKWIITNANRDTEKLFQLKRNQLVGRSIWEILPEEEATRFYQFFRKARKNATTIEFEEYYEPFNQWYDIILYPSMEGMAVCVRNVTERRRKNEERKKLMEQLVTQNRDLEEFTFITSHSLRAQIANISMLCSAMDSSGLTPENQEIFEKLYSTSSKLDGIISDLNSILTIKDRTEIQVNDFRLVDAVEHAIGRIPYTLSPMKKFIGIDIDPNLSACTIQNYVEAILTQLLTNSLKFRKKTGEPRVLLQAAIQADVLEISVIDRGLGMDTSQSGKQIFHLYKTFHPGTSGKGLGLYLCKTMVDEMRGEIGFDSEEGIGSTVKVRIPLT
jgi:PAS domain S-box-containing protein